MKSPHLACLAAERGLQGSEEIRIHICDKSMQFELE